MYSHVVLGGTFDHLHAGHEDLLKTAFRVGLKVTLGLTKASMNKNKVLSDQIQPYAIRRRAILELAHKLHRRNDLRIIPISDIFGTTLVDSTLEAILVTDHSKRGAQKINEERLQRGLPSLHVEICPLRADEAGQPISSTNIRLGKISRNGLHYFHHFTEDVILPDSAKSFFKRPFRRALGARKLRDGKSNKIVVGDMVTQYCIVNSIHFQTAFIDKKTKREPFSFEIPSFYTRNKDKIENPAGVISKQSSDYLITHSLKKKNTVVEIIGEEDLLTVAAIILLPLGTDVIYGYPYLPSSLRRIRVNERIKQAFFEQLFA